MNLGDKAFFAISQPINSYKIVVKEIFQKDGVIYYASEKFGGLDKYRMVGVAAGTSKNAKKLELTEEPLHIGDECYILPGGMLEYKEKMGGTITQKMEQLEGPTIYSNGTYGGILAGDETDDKVSGAWYPTQEEALAALDIKVSDYVTGPSQEQMQKDAEQAMSQGQMPSMG